MLGVDNWVALCYGGGWWRYGAWIYPLCGVNFIYNGRVTCSLVLAFPYLP